MPKGIYKRTKETLRKLEITRNKNKHIYKNKEKAYASRSGNLHHSYKGENAGYCSKHGWIKKIYGKANKCKIQDETCKGRFEWSNKDHKYSRNLEDWQMLCCSHHKRYDIKKFNIIPWNKGNRNKFRGLWLKKGGLLEDKK